MWKDRCLILLVLLAGLAGPSAALNIVLAGGTGEVARALVPRLVDHQVSLLARNAFLAAAPNRVTGEFGWVGASFLERYPHATLRDWDGGDLLDIVGQDWIGWQDDCLKEADVVVHLVGGFTEQRVMACERLVRESWAINKEALHVTVNPTPEDMAAVSPLCALSLKQKRADACESIVKGNCLHSKCLRVEAFRVPQLCDEIVQVIEEWAKEKAAE